MIRTHSWFLLGRPCPAHRVRSIPGQPARPLTPAGLQQKWDSGRCCPVVPIRGPGRSSKRDHGDDASSGLPVCFGLRLVSSSTTAARVRQRAAVGANRARAVAADAPSSLLRAYYSDCRTPHSAPVERKCRTRLVAALARESSEVVRPNRDGPAW